MPRRNVTFIWTSDIFKSYYILPGLALWLAACEGGFGPPPDRAVVARGAVVIAGPAGYCVDRRATQDQDGGAFVLLGSCASIADNARLDAPQFSGALTASVLDKNSSDIVRAAAQLSAFFATDPGRAALARNGEAASVSVLSAREQGGVFIMEVRDASPNTITGLAPEYWRALFNLRGRMVTLSVNSFQDRPMNNVVGLAVLDDFVARMRAENPQPVDPADDPV